MTFTGSSTSIGYGYTSPFTKHRVKNWLVTGLHHHHHYEERHSLASTFPAAVVSLGLPVSRIQGFTCLLDVDPNGLFLPHTHLHLSSYSYEAQQGPSRRRWRGSAFLLGP